MVFVVKQYGKTFAAFSHKHHAYDYYNWNEPDEMSEFIEDSEHILEDYLDECVFSGHERCCDYACVDNQGTTVAAFRYYSDQKHFVERWFLNKE